MDQESINKPIFFWQIHPSASRKHLLAVHAQLLETSAVMILGFNQQSVSYFRSIFIVENNVDFISISVFADIESVTMPLDV